MKHVALIAVAKDEDSYIHEWIHHHLYLGFSPIYIGVNRTSDKTLEIINKISINNKDVKAFVLDWIDQSGLGLNKRIQNIGYAYLSSKVDKYLVDYVGFLDIDEFWFNFQRKSIQEFIEDRGYFDIVSFNWLCQLGEDAEFSPPFKNVKYEIDGHVKSITHVKILEKVEFYTYHVPTFKAKFYNELIHIDQVGNNISCLNDNGKYNRQLPLINKENPSSCILHRMLRSEREYLSLVLRGRPNGELIKSNGRLGIKKASNNLPLIFNEEYYLSLEQFIKTNKLTEILDLIRAKKLDSFQEKVENMNGNQLISERHRALDALHNTGGLKIYVTTFTKKVTDVQLLMDFAKQLEQINNKCSEIVIQKIHEINSV